MHSLSTKPIYLPTPSHPLSHPHPTAQEALRTRGYIHPHRETERPGVRKSFQTQQEDRQNQPAHTLLAIHFPLTKLPANSDCKRIDYSKQYRPFGGSAPHQMQPAVCVSTYRHYRPRALAADPRRTCRAAGCSVGTSHCAPLGPEGPACSQESRPNRSAWSLQ